MSRVEYLQNRISQLEAELEEAKINGCDEDQLIDISLDLNEAKDQLNFVWQDDELESLGLL